VRSLVMLARLGHALSRARRVLLAA